MEATPRSLYKSASSSKPSGNEANLVKSWRNSIFNASNVSPPHPIASVGLQSPSRAAHRHLIQLDRRHSHADGHALPIFSAGSDAFVQLEVVAHHRDVFQRIGAVADQRRIAHRGGHLAVFDQISLRRG